MVRNENFDEVEIGENVAETISGTGATLSFSGNADRDIHDVTDVTLSNGTTASVTENITANYYAGIDATGTLIASETQSITLAAGASATATFLTNDFSLGAGDYFIQITTTSLTADGIDEHVLGAQYVTGQTDEGDLVTVDQNGRERARYDATSETVSYPSVDAGSVTSQSVDTEGLSSDAAGPFSDGFGTDTSADWDVVSGSATWDTTNSRLELSTDTVAVRDETGFGRGIYEGTVEDGGGYPGVVWAVQSSTAFYLARIRADNNVVQVYRVVDNTFTLIGDVSATIDPGVQYTLTIDWNADTGSIEVYLDDSLRASPPAISLQDATHGPGQMGARTSSTGTGNLYDISFDPNGATTTTVSGHGVSTSSVDTESLHTGRAAVPSGTSFADIQALIDDPEVRQINLAGKHYTGDSAIVIENQRTTNSRDLLVNAFGSVLEATGTNNVIRIRNGADKYAQGIEWHGGALRGPGSAVASSACVLASNCYGIVVDVREVSHAEHGIFVVNQDTWCEANTWRVRTANNSDIDYLVRLAGGVSSHPLASGTVSHRNSEVYIDMAGGGVNDGGKVFWQDHASIHGGRLKCRGFLPNAGIGMHVDGTNGTDVIEGNYTAEVEFEFGDVNSTCIQVDSNAGITFLNPRLRASQATKWSISKTPRLTVLDKSGIEDKRFGTKFGINGSYKPEIRGSANFRPNDNESVTWDYNWAIFRDSSGSAVYSFGNQGDDLTLRTHNGGDIRAIDGTDSPVAMFASRHRSSGATGSRSHRGKFAEHPIADNGDTWYIDGTGTPVEGVYAQTSGGPVKLG